MAARPYLPQGENDEFSTIVPASDVELVLDAHAPHGEGPVWLTDENILVWLYISGGLVNRYNPVTRQNSAIEVGQPVGAVTPRAAGGLMMALRDGIATLNMETSRVDLIIPVERDKTGNRMNDGKCDSAGRFWAGTMAFDSRPHAGAFIAWTSITVSSPCCIASRSPTACAGATTIASSITSTVALMEWMRLITTLKRAPYAIGVASSQFRMAMLSLTA